MDRWLPWWRHWLLGGLTAGLLVSVHVPAPPGWMACAVALSAAAALAGREVLGDARPSAARLSGAFLICLFGVGALIGLGVGSMRISAIDGEAHPGNAGERISTSGFVAATPRRSYGEVRVQLETPDGRVVLVAPEPVGDLPIGSEVAAEGRLAAPDEFQAPELERIGAAFELRASEVTPTGAARGGVPGALDGMRAAAEEALGKGLTDSQAALARGFVLGQDDRIDLLTREEFRRSGLSHLLAVSGQNVMLLAVLAGVILAPLGIGLRARLAITILLIACYVPIAGAGPSIQRAGVMGVVAIVAVLAGRPTARAYPPLLAAAATLAVNPRFGGDVAWQLSFAAVIGIMLWGPPLMKLIVGALGRRLPEPIARGAGEGIAITVAATLATAPLVAHEFERISLASVPANLMALPAVAPVMWIGMLISIAGQLSVLHPPGLAFAEGLLLDYIAWVARLFGSGSWAEVEVELPSTGALLLAYLFGSVALMLCIRWWRRRGELRIRPAIRRVAASLAVLSALLLVPLASDGSAPPPPPRTLQVIGLDVGQGDAVLLRPPRGSPVLVDAGPPGGAAARALSELGVDRLSAIFVTHDDLDHAGGVYEVLEAVEVERMVRVRPAARLESAARSAGARVFAAAEGSSFRFGRLTLDALWPPRARVASQIAPANEDSLVLAVGFGGYRALLTGDAESEVTHLDPGPFDVLKVAHHGSDDAGLAALLERSVPRVALIGVGAENTYGHPTPGTLLTLADHGVCALRTDIDGEITVELGPAGVTARSEGGSPSQARPGCA